MTEEVRVPADTGALPLPTDRTDPLEPPARLLEILADRPLGRLAFPDGQTGWLVTRYSDARAVLADPRFSSRRELIAAGTDDVHPPVESTPGFFISLDPPDHTRYRRALTGMFTVRRIRALTPRIETIVDDHLDRMCAAGAPADLVGDFALPVPLFVVCELLGVPETDRGAVERWTARMTDLTLPEEDGDRAHADLVAYLTDLVQSRRGGGGDDILSDLLGAGPVGAPFDDAEIAGIGSMLLNAGHETTAGMISLATLLLLTRPDVLREFTEMIDDPPAVERAVEEILRYLTILHLGLPRVAVADVELGAARIRRGERVLVSLLAANRDPARFDRPDMFDLGVARPTHLAFGHGLHQCLGQQLARVELRIVLTGLLRRLPGIQLAIPAAEVPVRDDTLLYGVEALPVAW